MATHRFAQGVRNEHPLWPMSGTPSSLTSQHWHLAANAPNGSQASTASPLPGSGAKTYTLAAPLAAHAPQPSADPAGMENPTGNPSRPAMLARKMTSAATSTYTAPLRQWQIHPASGAKEQLTRRKIFHLGLAPHPPREISFKQVRLVTPRFPTEIPKIEPKKMPLPTLQRPPMTEVSENPLATPWKSRTSEGASAVPKPVLKGIETVVSSS